MKEKFRITIVDDHALFAEGLSRILRDDKFFAVERLCNSGDELLHALVEDCGDIVLLDIQMDGKSGLETCLILRQRFPKLIIILLSMFESSSIAREAKIQGANAYLPKSMHAHEMKKAIHEVIQKPNEFHSFLVANVSSENDKVSPMKLISKRELEIIQLVKKGHTSKVIAEQLHISQYTVDTHRKNVMRKLDLNSIKDLISFAHEQGL